MCKVYTGYHGTSEIEHVCAHVRSITPSLKPGDYLLVQAHKPCSISHLVPYFLANTKHCKNIPISVDNITTSFIYIVVAVDHQ